MKVILLHKCPKNCTINLPYIKGINKIILVEADFIFKINKMFPISFNKLSNYFLSTSMGTSSTLAEIKKLGVRLMKVC